MQENGTRFPVISYPVSVIRRGRGTGGTRNDSAILVRSSLPVGGQKSGKTLKRAAAPQQGASSREQRAGSREQGAGARPSNIEHRTPNTEHPTSNASRIMTFRAREVGWGEAAGGTQRTEGKESDRFSDARVRGRERDLGSVDSLLGNCADRVNLGVGCGRCF